MKRTLTLITLTLVAWTMATLPGGAQPTTTSPPAAAPKAPPSSAWDDWVKQIKAPSSVFNWGADVRLRNEYFDNALSLMSGVARHEQDYFRFRERLWATLTPWENISLSARFSGEQREWMRPSYAGQYGSRSGLEERYGILDNAYLKLSNIADFPLTITAGRQDILLGEPLDWWLVADGTPGDGSWTFFLDSIRLSYNVEDIKTRLDLVYIYQNMYPDDWIPTLGKSSENHRPGSPLTPNPYLLTEQDEQGVILYASNKSLEKMAVDGYFIYKRDHRMHTDVIRNGDDADIYTVGGKIYGTPTDHFQYSLEGAYQFGNKRDPTVGAAYSTSAGDRRSIDAFGATGKAAYLFKDKLNNQARFVFEFLSGDDPNSAGTDEMFDVLWGRWPRWSELYIYSYVFETSGKIAQVNNVGRFGPQWAFNPDKKTSFTAMYNALFAHEEVPTRSINPGLFTRDGNFRGHYVQGVLKRQFTKQLSGHLWAEFVFQGDYYSDRDMLMFLRGEILFTF